MSNSYQLTSLSAIVLDTSVLGIVTNPTTGGEADDCRAWLDRALDAGVNVIVPEIADYELRRELVRGNRQRSLRRPDTLMQQLIYAPITTPIMREASRLWADARNKGHVTASNDALDGDVILAATARNVVLSPPHDIMVISTTNVGHMAFFGAAARWQDIGTPQP